MRQAHPAGERMFVDYAGQTVDLIDPGTVGLQSTGLTRGEIRPAQIFVAVMGASNYTPAFAGAGSMPRRRRRRACRIGLAHMSARSPSWVACRRSWCPTIRSACPGEGRGRH
jgi:transposase